MGTNQDVSPWWGHGTDIISVHVPANIWKSSCNSTPPPLPSPIADQSLSTGSLDTENLAKGKIRADQSHSAPKSMSPFIYV